MNFENCSILHDPSRNIKKNRNKEIALKRNEIGINGNVWKLDANASIPGGVMSVATLVIGSIIRV